jgi:hypothetical protein
MKARAYLSQEALFDDPVRRTYRLWLARRWSVGPSALFIMLNPSISDEREDSRTLRWCVGFAQAWGYAALEACNLFAFVDQGNDLVHRTPDAVGPHNDEFTRTTVQRVSADDGIIIAAWGTDGARRGRDEEVIRLVTEYADLMRIGPPTQDGHPRHPLYLRRDLAPELHRPRQSKCACR